MKILEQILKEIEAVYEIPFFETVAEGRAYMQGKAAQANEDRRIIHSHMEDDGWIPAEERLPDERQQVYIRLDNGNVFLAEIRARELLKEWWYCYGETDDMDMLGMIYEVEGWTKSNPVVAWRPLPEPYRKKED